MRRLKYSNRFICNVTDLVQYHDVVLASSKPCARRWLAGLGEEQLNHLVKVHECDLAAHTKLAYPHLKELKEFYALLDEVRAEESAFTLKSLAVKGSDLLDIGIKEGRVIGEILNILLNEFLDDRLITD